MNCFLENSVLKVEISDFGAEMVRVYDKEKGMERIWKGDSSIWNRHSPILFPFIGRVKNGVYRAQGKEFEMKDIHGFACNMDFTCITKGNDSITHGLSDTEETRKIYPYPFELFVTHRMDEENPRVLHVDWKIRNNGSEEMYYSIGAHPGFALPIEEDQERENYLLEFPGKEKLWYYGASMESGLVLPHDTKLLLLDHGFAGFTDDIYATLIFENQGIDTVRIAKPDGSPFVTVNCKGFPVLSIWTSPAGGNYLCLEPWCGCADVEGFSGSIEEKICERRLCPGQEEQLTYSMEFH